MGKGKTNKTSKLHWPPEEQLRLGREIMRHEADALAKAADQLDPSFCQAVDLLVRCTGSVIVSGMGKAGLVGQKIMATLASTGTRAHFLHPAEAVHGDLGRIHRDDLVLLLSQSGETEEVTRILPPLAELGVPIIAITAGVQSTLGRAATVVLSMGKIEEACCLGLAPSTSTTVMLAIGDAMALVASRMVGFEREDFARFHPAGSLGQKLSKVEQIMRGLDQCRIASDSETIRKVLLKTTIQGRRTGAVMLVDAEGQLSGFFTDSDLARLFEENENPRLDVPIRDVMTHRPMSVPLGSKTIDAVNLLAERKISELPVVDKQGCPQGMIDVTDVLGMMPPAESTADKPTLTVYKKPA
ncbi:MAG: KpsF/GutQ family sugar-phosphate isomerase [Planctomycetia bacterium]|jgi:arabinose-5-phosphate isomerase